MSRGLSAGGFACVRDSLGSVCQQPDYRYRYYPRKAGVCRGRDHVPIKA